MRRVRRVHAHKRTQYYPAPFLLGCIVLQTCNSATTLQTTVNRTCFRIELAGCGKRERACTCAEGSMINSARRMPAAAMLHIITKLLSNRLDIISKLPCCRVRGGCTTCSPSYTYISCQRIAMSCRAKRHHQAGACSHRRIHRFTKQRRVYMNAGKSRQMPKSCRHRVYALLAVAIVYGHAHNIYP